MPLSEHSGYNAIAARNLSGTGLVCLLRLNIKEGDHTAFRKAH